MASPQADRSEQDYGHRFKITNMFADGDPEAYINTFNKVTTAERWPKNQWASILTLTGLAQAAVDTLPVADAAIYNTVTDAANYNTITTQLS